MLCGIGEPFGSEKYSATASPYIRRWHPSFLHVLLGFQEKLAIRHKLLADRSEIEVQAIYVRNREAALQGCLQVEPHFGAPIGRATGRFAVLVERGRLDRLATKVHAVDYLAVPCSSRRSATATPKPPTSIFTLTGLSSRIILATRPATSIVSRP